MNYDDIPLLRVVGLSLTRPWPWAFDHGKRVENRSWKFPPGKYRFTIALHAAKSWSEHDREFIERVSGVRCAGRTEHPDSQITATVNVDGCYEVNDPRIPAEQKQWSFGPYVWTVSNYIKLIEPVQCVGGLSLWSFHDRQKELAELRRVWLLSQSANAA